jgi:asparagine synthase (glutamine-hydrolysing)
LFKELHAYSSLHNAPLQKALYRLCLKPLIPDNLRKGYHYLRGHQAVVENQVGLKLNSDFSKRIAFEEYLQEVEDSTALRKKYSARQNHQLSVTSGLFEHVTAFYRFVGDHSSIEVRCPFLDKRLIAFSLAVPLKTKMKDGLDRAILRYAMKNYLPHPVFGRVNKSNLSANLHRGIHSSENGLIKHAINDATTTMHQFVDIEEAKKNYKLFIKEPLDKGSQAINMFIYSVLTQWMKLNSHIF